MHVGRQVDPHKIGRKNTRNSAEEKERQIAAIAAVIAVFLGAIVLIQKGVFMLIEVLGAAGIMLFLNIGAAALIYRQQEKDSQTALKKMRKSEQLQSRLPPFTDHQEQALFQLIRMAVHEERSFWVDFTLNMLFFVLGIAALYLIR